jgi:flagellar biosynthesis protein FlhG
MAMTTNTKAPFTLEPPMDQASTLRGYNLGRPLRAVSVVSGKGGVGKTFVSTSMALCAARAGHRVLLLDADLGLANADIVLGVRPRYHLGDLLAGRPPEEVVVQGPEGVHLLAGGSGLSDLTHLGPDAQRQLIDALAPLENKFDVLIVDAGAGIGENVCFFASATPQTVLVLGEEPTALTDAYATVKVLSQQAGVRHFKVLVNDVPGENEARQVFAALSQVSARFLTTKLTYLGSVPHDEIVRQAVMQQKPAVVAYPHARATRALEHVTRSLLASEPEHSQLGGLQLFWERALGDARSQPPA